MRIEDGIFGRVAQIDGPRSVDDTLPLHTETYTATKNDVSKDAYLENGNPNPDYYPSNLTVMNVDGEPAKEGDSCYTYPAMAGRCVKIYTNSTNANNVVIRPLEGNDNGDDDITIQVFSGMMLPIPCKGIGLPAGANIVILA